MGTVLGSEILAQSLKSQGVDTMFYIMGGPMLETEATCIKLGIRAIDTRHEQAAALSAEAWGRVMRRPGVSFGMEAFQEIDKLAVFKPVTKWAERIYDARRIPEHLATAFRQATTGRVGPVYLDLPGDVLGEKVDESRVVYPPAWKTLPRARGDEGAVKEAIALLGKASRPIVLGGSGVWWSDAAKAFQAFVETSGIPFYTTPLSRGSAPDDHPLSFLNARSSAFREADVILAVGVRFNWVVQFGAPPRFAQDLKVIHVDINPAQIGWNRDVEVPIVGDARAVLEQLGEEAKGKLDPKKYAPWVGKLRVVDGEKNAESEKAMSTDNTPIHPLRLCKEVRDFVKRDAILVVDGQEILNFGRQSIPTFVPGHRMNSGTFGCMGVGLPFGLGAKVAQPDKQVVVLHGDGSYGEFVEKPHDVRPALERAYASGKPAVVNVMTSDQARATTVRFSAYTT